MGHRLLSNVDGPDSSRLVSLLAAYAGDPKPEVADCAAGFLVQYVRQSLKEGRATSFWEATDALARHPELGRLLREIVDAPVELWARSMALQKLAKLEKKDCLSLLQARIDDPLLGATAAAAIGEVAEGTGDQALLALLVRKGESVRDPGDLACVAYAVRSIGGEEARPTLAPWVDRLEGWSRTEAAWFVRDISPSRALARLVELEILPRVPERALCDSPEESVRAAFNETTGQALINVHALNEPLRYERILGCFEVARRDFFLPRDVRQEKTSDGGHAVEFTHRGRPYRFKARDLGPWVDLPPAVEAANAALADDDIPERFVGLRGYLHVAVFVVAVPDRLERAAKELYLPLEPDADATRTRWLRDEALRGQRPAK